MKRTASFLIALLLFAPLFANAATAKARLFCLSVRMTQGVDEYGDTLDFTSTGGHDAGWGELGTYYPPGTEWSMPGPESYATLLSLFDTGYGYAFGGTVYTSIPAPTDEDNNRVPDFFDVSRPVNYAGGGTMLDLYAGDTYYSRSFSWLRSAGSKNGRFTLGPVDPGWYGTFVHTFEILEYKGTFAYTPGSNAVSGTLNVTQTGAGANTIQATLQFVKSTSDHFNQLTLLPGTCSGTFPTPMNTFTNHLFTRDMSYPTNYSGFFEFSAGDSVFVPFGLWVLSIDDANDTDGNGIPDFSDDPSLPPPRAGRLSLGIGTGNLQLSISGDVGRQYEIQASSSLASANWPSVQTVTLVSDPQTITLPAPTGTTFWRVVGH